jgi:hypothetical protein
MIKNSILFASVCTAIAVAVPLSPAMADAPVGLAGTLSGMYGSSFLKGAGTDSSADSYGIGGSGAFGFGIPNFAAEIDGSYGHIGTHGNDADTWGIGGNVFWANAIGRAGATISYNRISLLGAGSGLDFDTTNYGAFGEYYVNDMVTLAAKAGWTHATANLSGCGGEGSDCSGSSDGNYVGGAITGYVIPDVALWGAIDYVSFDSAHFTSYTVGAEYLFSEMLPISGFASWTNTQVSDGGAHENTFLFGIRYYFNENGSSLKDRQRNGTLGWLSAPVQILR